MSVKTVGRSFAAVTPLDRPVVCRLLCDVAAVFLLLSFSLSHFFAPRRLLLLLLVAKSQFSSFSFGFLFLLFADLFHAYSIRSIVVVVVVSVFKKQNKKRRCCSMIVANCVHTQDSHSLAQPPIIIYTFRVVYVMHYVAAASHMHK